MLAKLIVVQWPQLPDTSLHNCLWRWQQHTRKIADSITMIVDDTSGIPIFNPKCLSFDVLITRTE